MVMSISQRLAVASKPAALHLAISALVAAMAAFLVFGVWYPHPFGTVSGGTELFTLLIVVDVVIGPLLTLVLYNPLKPRRELQRDLLLVAALQLGALLYGLHAVHAARPVFLAFEGNRFRAVSAAELDPASLKEARHGLARLSHLGPLTIAARLAQPTDADFTESVRQSVSGLHPSLRPSRWEPYDAYRPSVKAELRPLQRLMDRSQEDAARVREAIAASGLAEARLGYLPLQSRKNADWIVIVDRETADIKAFAAVDGW